MLWVLGETDRAPPFVMAKAGYDVWLGNNRGNRFSSNHVSLDNKTEKFWEEVGWE